MSALLDVLSAQERVVSELSKEIVRLRTENDTLRAENMRLQSLADNLAHDAGQLRRETIRLRAALSLYADRLNWHYERLGSERVHPNEVNLYSWEGIEHQQPWQIARDALKDGDA